MSDDHPKFTCNTCGLSFTDAEYQREHMKTDWHRYNLKRRVANLPPIPSDVFAEKMIQQRSAQLEPKPRNANRQVTKKDLKRMEKERRRQEATAASGTAPTEDEDNLSDSGSITSRAHSVTSAMSNFSLGDPVRSGYQTEEDDFSASEDENDQDEVDQVLQHKIANMVKIPVNISFMDGHVSDSVEANVDYLERKYGLYVPERKFLTDLEGLVEYLNEKVGLGNCCLSCSYMGRSLEAVRAHMVSKQHVKVPYETENHRAELADFYDFSSSYSANGDEWEEVSDEDGETDYTVRVQGGDDEDAVDNSLYVDGYELVVGPGKVAGHRSLQRYYKQRFNSLPEKEGPKAVKMIDMRGPGVTEKETTKMIKQTWKEEKKQQHTFYRRDKFINNQKHFRDELLQ